MPIVTLPGGELRDEIRQPAYDTIVLPAAATAPGVRTFFQTLTVGAGAPKSLAQTNMTQAGQFPTATSFRVQGLCIDADNVASANNIFLPLFLRKSSIELDVGVKTYWQSPTRFACGRMQNVYSTGTGTAADLSYQQFGWAAVQPVVFQGKHVVDINPLQNFSITWTTVAADLTAAEIAAAVAAGTDLVFVASLKGLLRRPVQ